MIFPLNFPGSKRYISVRRINDSSERDERSMKMEQSVARFMRRERRVTLFLLILVSCLLSTTCTDASDTQTPVCQRRSNESLVTFFSHNR